VGACLRVSVALAKTMSRPQDDRNQEATVYLVRPIFARYSVLFSPGSIGQSRRKMHRCVSLGAHASSWPSRYVRHFMSFVSLLTFASVNVHLPKDRISMAHQGYGFCEFLTEEDAEYACKIMNQIKLWGKPIRVNKVCYYFRMDGLLF